MFKKSILIIGSNGMFGSYLLDKIREDVKNKSKLFKYVDGVDVGQIDITDENSIDKVLSSKKYDIVVNCAAITDTNKCEKELEELSFNVNAIGSKLLAKECYNKKIKLIHISTDYVFSQLSVSHNEHPINKYGMHKLIGELFIKDEFKNWNKGYCIVRTSWLFGSGKQTFIHKFLNNVKKALTEGRKEVVVTSDNYGKPTSCEELYQFIKLIIKNKIYGILDGQYLGQTISRSTFAYNILRFWNEISKNKFNTKYIKIHKISSNNLNLPIKHPTKIPIYTLNGIETMPTIGYKKYFKIFNHLNKKYMISQIKIFLSNNYSELEKIFI